MTEHNHYRSQVLGQIYGRVSWITSTDIGVYIWAGTKQIRAVLLGDAALTLMKKGIQKGDVVTAGGEFSVRSSTHKTTGELISDLLCYPYVAFFEKVSPTIHFRGSAHVAAKIDLTAWDGASNVIRGSTTDKRTGKFVSVSVMMRNFMSNLLNDEKRANVASSLTPHRQFTCVGSIEPNVYVSRQGVLTEGLTILPDRFSLQA